MTLYLDTSVLGGFFDKEFEVWTRGVIEKIFSGEHVAMISDILLFELERAPQKVRNLAEEIIATNAVMVVANDSVKFLSEKYISEKIVTKKYFSDALHIATASVHRADVLISWNFKHIVNLNRIRFYNSVNLKSNYNLLEIRSPREILSHD